ncbi:MAG: toprim domain-containing protein [Gammaproteobacteria bacterium]
MTIENLKSRIDLHDLADRLSLVRPGNTGNYRSPRHEDKTPSLSIYERAGEQRWKDWSEEGAGGSCIDLVMYVRGLDVVAAIEWLRDEYDIPRPAMPNTEQPKREATLAEFIAEKCLKQADLAKAYLKGRGITEDVIEHAIKCRSVGFNTYNSNKLNPGEVGYGGPAAAFIVRSINPGHVMAVDLRYIDPELNGGAKTQCQGEKVGYPWFIDLRALQAAKTVYVVESPINALSIACCKLPGAAAVAVRGVNVDGIDWGFLAGKRVIICLDADQPNEHGKRPGPEAAWRLYELLVDRRITAGLVEQKTWHVHGWNDVNDILTHNDNKDPAGNIAKLKKSLTTLEEWAIAGLPGDKVSGRKRIFLPEHDFAQYWKFRVREDFSQLIKKTVDEEGKEEETYSDLAGFRVAAINRVNVASAVSTLTGKQDSNTQMLMAISVQTPRHGQELHRKVINDDKLHNADMWGKFGPIFNKPAFLRLINILERSAALGSRTAANFVGLCWRDGNLTVNEGPDTFFTDPRTQCPYHALRFPSGDRFRAEIVLLAYQRTFKRNAATILLAWALGGHLKAFLGFWPHMTMQAKKGAGKSTLIKRLEQTIAFTMFSGQSLQTEFRLLTSISHSFHPVGWEEISARKQDIIDRAVAMLQESYQYTITRRGADLTEFVMCAPVLLAGEDVPVRSLIGKLVRTDLTGKKGPLMPSNLPEFPVKQWLHFLAEKSRDDTEDRFQRSLSYCEDNCRSPRDDDGAQRMATNYAAILTAWKLLCEFSGLDPREGGFAEDLIAEMNSHIAETDADREPWVWIVEIALSEIASGSFKHPYKYEVIDIDGIGETALLIRPGHIVDHIAHTPALRDRWNAMPIKSTQAFRKQLESSGVIIKTGLERIIGGSRVAHMDALSLSRLETFGLYGSPDAYEHES